MPFRTSRYEVNSNRASYRHGHDEILPLFTMRQSMIRSHNNRVDDKLRAADRRSPILETRLQFAFVLEFLSIHDRNSIISRLGSVVYRTDQGATSLFLLPYSNSVHDMIVGIARATFSVAVAPAYLLVSVSHSRYGLCRCGNPLPSQGRGQRVDKRWCVVGSAVLVWYVRPSKLARAVFPQDLQVDVIDRSQR
jgi:hypothetical protein